MIPPNIWEVIRHFDELLQKSVDSSLKEFNMGSPPSDLIASQKF